MYLTWLRETAKNLTLMETIKIMVTEIGRSLCRGYSPLSRDAPEHGQSLKKKTLSAISLHKETPKAS
jgi:hypothetical protein